VNTSGIGGQSREAFNSLGDIDLAFEYQIFKKSGWAFSASLSLGFPLEIVREEVMGVIKLVMENLIKS